MMDVPSVTVEVNIQDCFWAEDAESDSPASSAQGEEPVVSQDTWETWFQTWMEALKPDLSPISAYELTLRLTTNADIHILNHQYRNMDAPTDVLAFAALDEENDVPEEFYRSQPLYLGDLVISVERAQEQAPEHDHSLVQELAWLAAHGLLHLLGWDHPDEESLTEMLTQQQDLLAQVKLTSSL